MVTANNTKANTSIEYIEREFGGMLAVIAMLVTTYSSHNRVWTQLGLQKMREELEAAEEEET